MILRRLVGGSGGDRLVEIRVERDALLVDAPHAERLELLPELALDQVHAVVDRLGVRLRRIDVREARQVVERVHEARHHLGLRLAPHFGPLPRHPLAEVVELGGEPEMLVLRLGQLGGELGDRLLEPPHGCGRGLDQRRAGAGAVCLARLSLWLRRRCDRLHLFPRLVLVLGHFWSTQATDVPPVTAVLAAAPPRESWKSLSCNKIAPASIAVERVRSPQVPVMLGLRAPAPSRTEACRPWPPPPAGRAGSHGTSRDTTAPVPRS